MLPLFTLFFVFFTKLKIYNQLVVKPNTSQLQVLYDYHLIPT